MGMKFLHHVGWICQEYFIQFYLQFSVKKSGTLIYLHWPTSGSVSFTIHFFECGLNWNWNIIVEWRRFGFITESWRVFVLSVTLIEYSPRRLPSKDVMTDVYLWVTDPSLIYEVSALFQGRRPRNSSFIQFRERIHGDISFESSFAFADKLIKWLNSKYEKTRRKSERHVLYPQNIRILCSY